MTKAPVSATTTAAPVPAVIDAAALPNARQELFAQNIVAGHSLADACARAGYSDSSRAVLWAAASRLAATPAVQARIRSLRDAAAERAVISISSRMQWLNDVVHADPSELSRVVACPCPACWDDMAYAVAVQRYIASVGTPAPLPPPDTTAPRHDCPKGPHQRVEIVPTAELSGPARAAFRGARQRPDGSIEVLMEDRAQCVDMLNKMQGVYVTKSLSLSATLNVPAMKDVSTEQALAMLESFK